VHDTDTSPPPAPGDHGQDHARLLRLARYQRTTTVLERRADRSANTALAAVLRERAAARRHVADRIRALLVAPPADLG
jgi:hypothetical protein